MLTTSLDLRSLCSLMAHDGRMKDVGNRMCPEIIMNKITATVILHNTIVKGILVCMNIFLIIG